MGFITVIAVLAAVLSVHGPPVEGEVSAVEGAGFWGGVLWVGCGACLWIGGGGDGGVIW